MQVSNMKIRSFFSYLIALFLLAINSVAHAGPMTAGQRCTAGSPSQGCVPGIYCVNPDGSPAFNGGGKCYPAGVPLGTYESFSPSLAEIKSMLAMGFITLGVGIQKWYPVQIQAISDGKALVIAVPGMTPVQIQALTGEQRTNLKAAIPEAKLNDWLNLMSTAQRQALGW